MVGKVKDGTQCHVVGIRTGTGYSMVNAPSIHYLKLTLNQDIEK